MADAKVLDAAMEKVADVTVPSDINGTGAVFIVNNDADPSLLAFRYRLKGAAFEVAEEPFEAAGRKFNRGSFIIRNAQAADVQAAGRELSLQAYGVEAAPAVKTHPVKAPRIGYIHTWLGTQDEGWWRMEFDRLKIPYDYISTQVVAKEANLNSKWDVLVFPPVGRGAQQIVAGHADVAQPAAVEDHAADAEHRQDRLDRRHAARPRLGRPGQPRAASSGRAAC